MQQIQQKTTVAPLSVPGQTRIVEIEGKLYQVQVSELSQLEPQPIQPQPISTGVSVQPQASPYITPQQFPLYLALGAGCMAIALVGAWVFMKAIVPPVTPATAVPSAPPHPQTVIIQPPVPERKPYRRRECKPAGALGWGSECSEERGYE